MNTNINRNAASFSGIGRLGGVLGVLGLLIIGAAYVMGMKDPAQIHSVMQSYLYGWIFAMLFSLGCYGFMLLHYMVKGSWGKPIVRMFEAGAKSLPVMGLLYIPVLLNYHILYPAPPAHRAAWMSVGFFAIRTVIYFGIWGMFTAVLTHLSRQQDETGDVALIAQRQKIAAAGFLIFVLSITFAFTDWVMALDAHWFSTIYGVWFMDFMGLTTLSFTALLATRFRMNGQDPYHSEVSKQVTRDWGNLLLMLTMLWAYFSLSQFLIIWSGNLPEEVRYYLTRNAGAFLFVGAFDIVFSFFVPFLCLLNVNTSRTPSLLTVICVLILVMRVIDLFWVVMPTAGRVNVIPSDAGAILFHLGLFLGVFSFWMSKNRFIPLHDAVTTQEVLAHG